MELGRGDAADSQIDRFIERRASELHKSREQETVERLWEATAREAAKREREKENARRREFHEGQAARLRGVMTSLIAHHEREAQRYRHNGHEESA